MDAREVNIITLAYLGDSVYEVFIRDYLIHKGIAKVELLQREAIKFVSAKSQAKIFKNLIDSNFLTEKEIEIVKRGRNYNRLSHPKNTDIITYKMSTGFEALIGYLYIDEKKERIKEIINYILEVENEKNC